MRRAAIVALALLPALGAGAAGAASAAPAPASRVGVSTLQTQGFGRVLTTTGKQALYYWTAEREGQVRCTGACAQAWPPLIVRRGVKVPGRIPGIRGHFGVVRRPDGRRQLTHDGRAVYTYANEGPRQVLCDNVNGWFVVRLSG